MPWKRNDTDPLEIKRRKLDEQQRLLAEQMSRLTEELRNDGQPVPEEVKRPEPPVWRLDDDGPHHRPLEQVPVRRRHLTRQRTRDMILFFVLVAILLLLLYLIWSAYAHHIE